MSGNPIENVGVVAGYDLWAADYDALDNPLVALASYAIAERAPRLAGVRVIELGCGTGRHAAPILGAGAASYLGVDVSAGMLARARARPLDARARWLNAPIEDVDAARCGSFDVVLFSLVLEHMASLDGAFRAARAVAAQPATLRAFELHPALHARGTRAHFRAGDRELALPSYAHDEAELAAALAGAGWSVEAVTTWFAPPSLTAGRPKLARYAGVPMMLEVAASVL